MTWSLIRSFDHPMAEGAVLYRVFTEDRIIDVLSPKPPVITVGAACS